MMRISRSNLIENRKILTRPAMKSSSSRGSKLSSSLLVSKNLLHLRENRFCFPLLILTFWKLLPRESVPYFIRTCRSVKSMFFIISILQFYSLATNPYNNNNNNSTSRGYPWLASANNVGRYSKFTTRTNLIQQGCCFLVFIDKS